MKRQFLHEHHKRQDQARKADYQEDIRLNPRTKPQYLEFESLKARRLEVLASVRKSVPFVGEFEQLFSGARISFRETEKHSSRTHTAWTFEAKVGLYGRYILNADLPIMVDTRKVVVSTSEPNLNIRTLRQIMKDLNERLHGSYEPNSWFSFGSWEWLKLVAARGDFSVIGFDMVMDAPLTDFDAFCECSGYINK